MDAMPILVARNTANVSWGCLKVNALGESSEAILYHATIALPGLINPVNPGSSRHGRCSDFSII